jgi:hypothetical protein
LGPLRDRQPAVNRLRAAVLSATRISVHVEIPQAEAHRLGTQREAIAASLSRLAAVVTA